jgi:hypothetical protein
MAIPEVDKSLTKERPPIPDFYVRTVSTESEGELLPPEMPWGMNLHLRNMQTWWNKLSIQRVFRGMKFSESGSTVESIAGFLDPQIGFSE